MKLHKILQLSVSEAHVTHYKKEPIVLIYGTKEQVNMKKSSLGAAQLLGAIIGQRSPLQAKRYHCSVKVFIHSQDGTSIPYHKLTFNPCKFRKKVYDKSKNFQQCKTT